MREFNSQGGLPQANGQSPGGSKSLQHPDKQVRHQLEAHVAGQESNLLVRGQKIQGGVVNDKSGNLVRWVVQQLPLHKRTDSA